MVNSVKIPVTRMRGEKLEVILGILSLPETLIPAVNTDDKLLILVCQYWKLDTCLWRRDEAKLDSVVYSLALIRMISRHFSVVHYIGWPRIMKAYLFLASQKFCSLREGVEYPPTFDSSAVPEQNYCLACGIHT